MPRSPAYKRVGTATRGINKATGQRGKPFEKGNKLSKGRPPGSRAKVDEIQEQLTTQALTEGLMPLEFFLLVMRDEKKGLNLRFEAAKAAAPYVHKRQPIAVEHVEQEYKVFDITQLEGLTDAELEAMETIMAKAALAEAKRANNPFLEDPRVREVPSTAPAPRQPERPALPPPIESTAVRVITPKPKAPWE
jgi:hypothetical protein